MFPYLLREHEITTPNQVWAMDLTCLSMRHEFLYGPFAYGPGRPDPRYGLLWCAASRRGCVT